MEARVLRVLDDRLGEFDYQARIVWSILEAVNDALQAPDAVPETYYGAIRGAADFAYRLNRDIGQLLTAIRG